MLFFGSHSWIEGRQPIDLDGRAVEKQAKEAAQVQEPYMYHCSHLETNTVLKAESAVFRNFVYTTFARFSDIVVQYSPRMYMQSYRGKEAAQRSTVVSHPRLHDSSPNWTKSNRSRCDT